MKKRAVLMLSLLLSLFAGTAAHAASLEGKVVSNMLASGYIYLEVDTGKEKVWVAAPETKIKNGDKVQFSGAMVMKNFTSKSLKRTFDKILFVDNAKIVK